GRHAVGIRLRAVRVERQREIDRPAEAVGVSTNRQMYLHHRKRPLRRPPPVNRDREGAGARTDTRSLTVAVHPNASGFTPSQVQAVRKNRSSSTSRGSFIERISSPGVVSPSGN